MNFDLGTHRQFSWFRARRRAPRGRRSRRDRRELPGERARRVGDARPRVFHLAQYVQEDGLVLAIVVIPLGFVLAEAREQMLLKGRQPLGEPAVKNVIEVRPVSF